MTTHIIINGREITNPLARGLFAAVAIIVAALVSGFVVFVLLPLIGIAVSLSIGFVLTFIVVMLFVSAVMAVGIYLYSLIVGPVSVRIDKHRKDR